MSRGISLLIRNTIGGGNQYFRSIIASFYIRSSLRWHFNPKVIFHIECFSAFLAIFFGLARNFVLEPTSSLLGIYFFLSAIYHLCMFMVVAALI